MALSYSKCVLSWDVYSEFYGQVGPSHKSYREGPCMYESGLDGGAILVRKPTRIGAFNIC